MPTTKSKSFSLCVQFFKAFLAQAVGIILFQIRLSRVGEFHLYAPAVDGVHALEFFSAAGTSLFHGLKKRETPFRRSRKMNINYLNNIALGMRPALNEASSKPSLV